MTSLRTYSISGLLLAFLLAFTLSPLSAYGDVRNSDEVRGMTAETASLTAAMLPNISAEYAYVVNDEGEEFFARASHEKTKIASITKVMTALVAMEYLDSDITIEVSENAASIGESSAMLQAGDKLSVLDALKALMICSGNDAAQALAENLGPIMLASLEEAGDDENLPRNGYDAFIQAMNDKAKELGMVDSKFGNPHGLDFDNYAGDFYSTAYDVSIMCRAAMENDTFREIVATSETTIPVERAGETVEIELVSTDLFLESYEGACGIKTGYTDQAGACFAGAADRDDELLYAIVLDSSDEIQRFTDTATLMNWVYNNTVDYPLINTNQYVSMEVGTYTSQVPVVAEVSNNSWVDRTFAATVQDPDETIEIFALDGNISQEASYYDVQGDVYTGQSVGTITFMQHNEPVITVELIAAEDCPGPNFFEGIGVFWDRIFRGIAGEPTEAASTLVNTTPLVSELKAA